MYMTKLYDTSPLECVQMMKILLFTCGVSEHEGFICHVNGPGKLLALCLVIHLLHGDVPLLAPGGGVKRKCSA